MPSKENIAYSPPINPYRRPSYLSRKEIALLRSRKLLSQVISNTSRNSIDECDSDKIYSNGESDSVRVNKVNNNKNNGTCSNDRVSFDVNSQPPPHQHHQQDPKQKGKMEEQLKDAKSTDKNTKKADIISGDDMTINKETVQNGSFTFGDPNQPSK